MDKKIKIEGLLNLTKEIKFKFAIWDIKWIN